MEKEILFWLHFCFPVTIDLTLKEFLHCWKTHDMRCRCLEGMEPYTSSLVCVHRAQRCGGPPALECTSLTAQSDEPRCVAVVCTSFKSRSQNPSWQSLVLSFMTVDSDDLLFLYLGGWPVSKLMIAKYRWLNMLSSMYLSVLFIEFLLRSLVYEFSFT